MQITLDLPENVYQNFTKLAAKKHRRVEDVIADKLQNDFAFDDVDFEEAVASWSNDAVLALANFKIPNAQADRMSELSERRQSGIATDSDEMEFEVYMELCQISTLRKAHGIVEAVKRGLITSPSDLK
ncbi:MAG: hypothetical protein H7Z37_10375 [Pyrinomonadaceae bacterium]|nr:hypothetical protein [Pyrinomonadaceae bacterium]